jgi:hypothetical protein
MMVMEGVNMLEHVKADHNAEDIDSEPFDSRDRTDEELADHDIGFEAGLAGEPNDETKSPSWQRGWADAQE